ncbi:MAG: hypothetical protein LBT45_01000 [Rickettsiales bacterium]|jgi:hypothetical protein|nr:hypothetical protein [Rickettsiales bacterium]
MKKNRSPAGRRARILIIPLLVFFARGASAYEYRHGRNAFRLTATGALISVNKEKSSDYLLRAQISRRFSEVVGAGFVYAYDRLARESRHMAKDAFAYVETEYGRAETGWTESIASKLALVLPDVGGLRLNNAPLFLPDDYVGITAPAVRGNQYAWRMNYATLPTKPLQFGIGRTFHSKGFDSSFDAGVRYRDSGGRIKKSLSLGFSYIDKPRGMIGDAFLPPVFADARYQGTAGANIQWGGLIWAATFKAVVDDNPTGFASDGLAAGTGVSYDFLSWSASASYIFSDVGVWRSAPDITAHTGVVSIRYKLTKHFHLSGSAGIVASDGIDDLFFISAGAGASF